MLELIRSNILKRSMVKVLLIHGLKDEKTKWRKIKSDIQLRTTCKQASVISTFGKLKLLIYAIAENCNLKIAKLALKNKVQAKHHTKKMINRGSKSLIFSLENIVNNIIFSAIIHQLNTAIKSHLKTWKKIINVQKKI